MQSNELETIAPSMQDARHGPYTPGRNDVAHNDNVTSAGISEREPHRAASPPGSIKGLLLDCRYRPGAKK